MTDAVTSWIEGYREAWESNDPDDIRALFTEDAVYRASPHDENPWAGHDAIVAGWLEHRDEPGSTTFEWQPVAVQDDVAVVQCVSGYPPEEGGVFDNLWVIRLAPDGRATEYTDWYIPRA